MKFHPDRNPGDKTAEANFKEIKEAYEILTDADKSGLRPIWSCGCGSNRGGGGYGGGQGDFGDIFGDVFGDIFGGGRRGGQRQAARSSDLRYNLELSLEEAVKGLTKELRIPTLATCDLCEGSGAKKAPLQPPVAPVMVKAKCKCAKVSLPCNSLVQPVMAAARSSKILALSVMAMAVLKRAKPYRLRSQPALIRVIVFV